MGFSQDERRSMFIERCVMGRFISLCLAGLMAIVLLAIPVTAIATDHGKGDDKHRLLTQQLRDRIEALKDRIRDHRDNHHNGGQNGTMEALQAQVTDLQGKIATMASNESALMNQLVAAQAQIAALLTRVSTLESGGGGSSSPVLTELLKHVKVEPNMLNGVTGPHVIFYGVNVHVQSGSNTTDDAGAPTGLGNLIIGYNEGPWPSGSSRNGSHNIVGGMRNAFSSSGGLVFGVQNYVAGKYGAVLAGRENTVTNTAEGSSILGNQDRELTTANRTSAVP